MVCFKTEKNLSVFCSLHKSLCRETGYVLWGISNTSLHYFLGQINTTGQHTSQFVGAVQLWSMVEWQGKADILSWRSGHLQNLSCEWQTSSSPGYHLREEESPDIDSIGWTLHEPSIQKEEILFLFIYFFTAPWLGGQTHLYSESKFRNAWFIYIYISYFQLQSCMSVQFLF